MSELNAETPLQKLHFLDKSTSFKNLSSSTICITRFNIKCMGNSSGKKLFSKNMRWREFLHTHIKVYPKNALLMLINTSEKLIILHIVNSNRLFIIHFTFSDVQIAASIWFFILILLLMNEKVNVCTYMNSILINIKHVIDFCFNILVFRLG